MARMPDRTAVMTGGSSGLGFALAELLGAQGIGVSIIARDPERVRDAVERLRNGGADATGIPCDISRQDQVGAAFDHIAGRGSGAPRSPCTAPPSGVLEGSWRRSGSPSRGAASARSPSTRAG